MSFGNESTCHVILDRKTYITNEIAYGSMIFGNQNMDTKVMRIHLMKADSDKILYDFCIKFDKKTASFYIPITAQYESGTYTLEFWACKTENKRGASLIHLGNTFLNILNTEDQNPNRNAFYNFISVNDCVKTMETGKKPIQKSGDNLILNASIADSLVLVCGSDERDEEINIATLNTGLTPNIIQALSDKIFTNVFVKDQLDQRKFVLLGLFSNVASKMFISNSNESGSSIFLFDNYEGPHKFNLFGLNSQNIQFIPMPKSADKTDKKPVDEVQWSAILKSWETAKKREEIHQHFDVSSVKMSAPIPLPKNKLPKPFKSIITTNYKKFSDFQAFCKENSLELKFDKKNDKTIAYLIPPPRFSHSLDARWDNPIFIIDGKCVTDASVAAKLKHEDIKKLNIHLDMKEITPWVYSFGSNGVIEIETSKNNIESPETLVYGFQNKISLPQQLISAEKSSNKPILLPTHYWNTNVSSKVEELIHLPSQQKGIKYFIFFKQDGKIKYQEVIM